MLITPAQQATTRPLPRICIALGVLATCRRRQNHGKFTGTIEEQFTILDLAVQHGAGAIDVEIETAELAAAQVPLVVRTASATRRGRSARRSGGGNAAGAKRQSLAIVLLSTVPPLSE